MTHVFLNCKNKWPFSIARGRRDLPSARQDDWSQIAVARYTAKLFGTFRGSGSAIAETGKS